LPVPPNDSFSRWPLARSKSLAILCIGAVKLAATAMVASSARMARLAVSRMRPRKSWVMA